MAPLSLNKPIVHLLLLLLLHTHTLPHSALPITFPANANMALCELPVHDLEMSEPAPSEVHQFKGKTFYCWLLSDTERSHIADMLQMDG